MSDINWNEVAWNTPNHNDGDYGYLPSDVIKEINE